MRVGDFEAAWRISDSVLTERRRQGLTCDDRPLHLRWVWDGTPLDGKTVLVRCYHGLGDVIQFIRLAAPLRKRARRVVIQAVPPLLPLIHRVDGVDGVVPLDKRAVDPAHDVAIELMELPHALRIDRATIPCRIPYLDVDGRRVAERRIELAAEGSFSVGVAWAAGAWRPERSFPIELLQALAAIPGVVLVNLQRGPALSQRGIDAGRAPLLREWGDGTSDIVETAAMLRALDLVISVDTMVAHLAGALGVRIWTLLHFDADWRWMLIRRDSPWYPTMTLFRQPAPGAWREVLGEVASALEEAVRDRGERRSHLDAVGSRSRHRRKEASARAHDHPNRISGCPPGEGREP